MILKVEHIYIAQYVCNFISINTMFFRLMLIQTVDKKRFYARLIIVFPDTIHFRKLELIRPPRYILYPSQPNQSLFLSFQLLFRIEL